MTFDYMALLAVASTIAGAGLLSDSPTAVIASMLGAWILCCSAVSTTLRSVCVHDCPTVCLSVCMLVSPLMGPILSITFGLSTLKWDIVKRGLRNELLGVLITFCVGVLVGGCAFPYYGAHFRSLEMTSRGKRKSRTNLRTLLSVHLLTARHTCHTCRTSLSPFRGMSLICVRDVCVWATQRAICSSA